MQQFMSARFWRNGFQILALCLIVLIFPAAKAHAVCSGPSGNYGAIVYNSSVKKFQYCNDTSWVPMNRAGTGTGGCSSPSLVEGQMVYNTAYNKLQGCAGNVHVPLSAGTGRSPATTWTDVKMKAGSTCGLKADATLWCWGEDGRGEAGVNSGNDYVTAPVKVFTSGVTGTSWTFMNVGCGIRNDGSAWCWGSNGNGQTGKGGSTSYSEPVPVVVYTTGVSGTAWTYMGAAMDSNCGIRDNGTAWCWGAGTSGQLGNGASSNSTSPVLVSTGGVTGTAWTSLGVGYAYACGLRNNGTLWCWGSEVDNGAGVFGNGGAGAGATTTSSTPVSPTMGGVSGTTWTSISVGGYNVCGIRDNGTAWCWGTNGSGQVGNGAGSFNETVPALVSTTGVSGTAWTAISASVNDGDGTCGIRNDNSLWCWGGNFSGQLGIGTTDTSRHNSPVAVSIAGLTGSGWLKVANSYWATCGIRGDGTLQCFGSNSVGQLGNGVNNYSAVPTRLSTTGVSGSSWTDVSSGTNQSSCAIRNDGTGWCWGNGVGTAFPYQQPGVHFPTAIDITTNSVTGTSWSSISVGDGHSCGIRNDGSVWCWSSMCCGNGSRYVGNGTNAWQSSPVALSMGAVTGSTWTQIGAGPDGAVCGIRNNGAGFCWGGTNDSGDPFYHFGQTGTGTDNAVAAPTAITLTGVTGTAWTQLEGGGCGVRDDGSGYCWGRNTAGAVGNGNTTQQNAPTPVVLTGVTGSAWTMIRKGTEHSCGLRDDGSIWCWGRGVDGQLGNGLSANSNNPVLVSATSITGSAWTSVTVGRWHTCGVRDDGRSYCWGAASLGLLGNGQLRTSSATPTLVSTAGVSGSNWSKVSTGSPYYSDSKVCGLRDDGSIWCWGNGESYLELGNELNVNYLTASKTACSQTSTVSDYSIMKTYPPGTLMYNSTFNVMQLCNSVGWIGLAKGISCDTPTGLSFTSSSGQAPVTIQSNIAQVTLGCTATVSISGTGTPQFRTCSDAACSSVLRAYSASSTTVSNGQYIQIQFTAANAPLTTYTANLTVGSGAASWTSTTQDWKYAFITTATVGTGGNLSGVSGANTSCTTLAGAASLPGTYRAWLASTAADQPSTTFTQSTVPYRMPNTNRTIVANNWADLIDGTLTTAITVTQAGGTQSNTTNTWTNVNTNGTVNTASNANNCTSWSISTNVAGGQRGSSSATGSTWTVNTASNCNTSRRLYCFQQ